MSAYAPRFEFTETITHDTAAGPAPGGAWTVVQGEYSTYPPYEPGRGLCYVRGCQQPTPDELTPHRDFGPVRTCASHHPERGDRGPRPAAAPDHLDDGQDDSQDDDHRDGGAKVRAPQPPPTTPPADGAALTVPAARVPALPAGLQPF